MATTTDTYDDVALAALIAAPTVLGSDLKMGLNTAIIDPSKQLVFADMTEPTFTGYAQVLMTMSAPFRDINLGICSLSNSCRFQATSGTPAALIQGFFIVGGTSSNKLYAYESLAQPFQFSDLLDALTIAFQYIQSSQNQGFGVLVV